MGIFQTVEKFKAIFKMNNQLRQQQEAFKKRALAQVPIQRKSASDRQDTASPKPTSKPKATAPEQKAWTAATTTTSSSSSGSKQSVGVQVLRVIEYLKKNRGLHTADQLRNAVGFDIVGDLYNSLKINPKITFDNEQFEFKPAYTARNKEEILSLLEKSFRDGKGGISKKDLFECYADASTDLEKLKEENKVYS
eukprot:Colp12_sorted_trinity150504_noHs@25145